MRKTPNNLQQVREEQLLSKAELARRAGVSALTIDRVEKGAGCRLDTKRKIILALGMKVTDHAKVFGQQGRGTRGNGRRGGDGDAEK